jgi:hypothetical protein
LSGDRPISRKKVTEILHRTLSTRNNAVILLHQRQKKTLIPLILLFDQSIYKLIEIKIVYLHILYTKSVLQCINTEVKNF